MNVTRPKPQKMPATAFGGALLESCWHARAQAARPLQSAALVFDSGDASSALALTMFCHYEPRRSKPLRERAADTQSVKARSAWY
jgi:hypothetical protein